MGPKICWTPFLRILKMSLHQQNSIQIQYLVRYTIYLSNLYIVGTGPSANCEPCTTKFLTLRKLAPTLGIPTLLVALVGEGWGSGGWVHILW